MSFPRSLRLLLLPGLLAAALYGQSPLTISTSSFPPGTVGQAYNQALTATGGTAPYSWSFTGQLPPGVTLSGSIIIGTPTSGGTYNFTLSVLDSRQAAASRSFSIVVGGSSRLAVTTSSLLGGSVAQSYSQTLTASGGTPPYSWTAQGLPSFLTLAAATGTISGTPTSAGTFNFSVSVTDSAANRGTASASLSLTVTAPAVTITTVAPIFNGTVGTTYAQTFRASGGSPPYTWSIISGSAGDLTLDAASGNLQGTPQTAGTFNFTIQATDRIGTTATQSYSLTVSPPTLTLTVGSQLPAGKVGESYSQKLPVVAGGGTPPYTFSVTATSTVPPGFSFDPASQIMSFTPNTAGPFNFTVQVADSAGSTATRPLSITINAAALSFVTAIQLSDGTLNKPYSQTIAASGGQPPYRWSASGLPTGLTINPTTAEISGTPTAAGNFGIAITVTDNALTNVSDRFTLNVNLPPAPGATISGLPGTVGPAQQFPLQVSISAPFAAPITGQAILSFSPDSGPADRTIQFSSGGTTASFNIPTGSTTADAPLAIQTGTVSGTINISLRLQAGGIDITPSPAPTISAQVGRAAPVIRSVQVNRSGNTINIVVTGYSTAREVTQGVFAFNAASGQTLQPTASSITVDLNTLFGNWFQDPNNSQFGSVFIFTQPFTVTGEASAVIPTSVTITNRIGSASFPIPQ